MNQSSKIVAVVPASGIGSRMKSVHPKQYLMIGELTILEHTVLRLLSHPNIDSVVVVISEKDQYYAKTSLSDNPRVTTAIGGKERADSVLSGLLATKAKWVMVHDAARPCVRLSDISKLIEVALAAPDGAILATPARDTIKQQGKDQGLATLNRAQIWHALTPQMFQRNQLISALQKVKQNAMLITDDASAIELMGGNPKLVEGRCDNIKITLAEDLALAAFFLSQNKE